MANPYDQFDGAQGNPYDRFDATAPTPKAPMKKGRGGSIGAGIRGALDTATFGTMDEIAAGLDTVFGRNSGSVTGWDKGFGPAFRQNLASQQGLMDADERDNPTSRLAGQVAGAFAMPGATAGAKLLPRLAVNAGQGAAYGFGSGQGGAADRGLNAAKGAVAAGLAGEAGRGVAKVAGRVIAPRVARAAADPALRAADQQADDVLRLANEGVVMPPGAIMGGMWKKAEDRVAGFPFVGDFVAARQSDSLDGLNRAAINRALKPLGKALPMNMKAGPEAQAFMQKAFDEAYGKARDGMEFAADETFNSAIDELQQRAAGGALAPDKAARFQGIVQNSVQRRLADGRMTGSTYKTVTSDLKKQAQRFLKPTATAEENELGDAIEELVGQMDDAARRVSDPRAVAIMDKADEGYAMAVRVENAAKMRGGDAGSFTANQLDSAVQKGDRTARSRAYNRGDALMQDLAGAGKRVLPSKVPDSGTPGRLALGAGALGYFEPATMAATAPVIVPYLPGVAPAVQNMLIRRRPGMIGAGKRLSKLAAPFGSASGLIAAEQVTR